MLIAHRSTNNTCQSSHSEELLEEENSNNLYSMRIYTTIELKLLVHALLLLLATVVEKLKLGKFANDISVNDKEFECFTIY